MSEATEEDMLLGDLLGMLFEDWPWILGALVLGLCAAAGLAFALPDRYESEATLARASAGEEGLDAMADRLGDLGGLAALALPGGAADEEKTIALAILQSRVFIVDFIERHDLLAAVTAVDGWDDDAEAIVFDSERYDAATRRWIPPEEGGTGEPSAQQAFNEFKDSYEIAEDPRTGLLTVLIQHESPQLAQQMVEWIVEDINEQLRRRVIEEAERSIRYLKEEIEANSFSDLDALLYRLVQSQTERLVLARARPEYAFRVIDPPVVSEQPATPRRSLIMALGVVLGGALGASMSLFRRLLLPRLRRPVARVA